MADYPARGTRYWDGGLKEYIDETAAESAAGSATDAGVAFQLLNGPQTQAAVQEQTNGKTTRVLVDGDYEPELPVSSAPLDLTALGILSPSLVYPVGAPAMTQGLLAWGAVNRAVFMRIDIPQRRTYQRLNLATSAGGTGIQCQYGLVALSGAGFTNYERIAHSGLVVPSTSAAVVNYDLGPVSLPAGAYALFFWADSTTLQTRWVSNAGFTPHRAAASVDLPGGVPANGTLSWGAGLGVAMSLEAP